VHAISREHGDSEIRSEHELGGESADHQRVRERRPHESRPDERHLARTFVAHSFSSPCSTDQVRQLPRKSRRRGRIPRCFSRAIVVPSIVEQIPPPIRGEWTAVSALRGRNEPTGSFTVASAARSSRSPQSQFFVTASPQSLSGTGELSAAAYMLRSPIRRAAPLLACRQGLLPPPDAGDPGFRMNAVSVVSSAFSVLFLYLIAVRLIRTAIFQNLQSGFTGFFGMELNTVIIFLVHRRCELHTIVRCACSRQYNRA